MLEFGGWSLVGLTARKFVMCNMFVRASFLVYRNAIRMPESHRILYCNCTYAQVVPREVKEAVLKKLCESNGAFDAVADLCEMSARHHPALKRLGQGGEIKKTACYPCAVKWLFAAANAHSPLGGPEVLNIRIVG